MASRLKKKIGLKAAAYCMIAGAHYINELVEKAQAMKSSSGTDAAEMRHAMLLADYERVKESPIALDQYVELLNEDEIFPFASEWPTDLLAELIHKLIPPKLSIENGEESDFRFRFKKGFKEMVSDFADSIDSDMRTPGGLDHWLTTLLNTAFHAGAVAAARAAENPKVYFDVMPELEDEDEPWTKYSQISELMDQQLRRETRRKTGLVSDLDY